MAALFALGLALILALPLTGHSSGQKVAWANQQELLSKPDASRNVVESVSGRKFAAEFGTLAVPENRRQTDSRLIQLPVVRVKAIHPLASDPVFYLFGGPGASNSDVEQHRLLDWFYEDFDAVYVGYRFCFPIMVFLRF